ncbi:MAG: sensor histidine kinase [Sphaerochaeta sp.]
MARPVMAVFLSLVFILRFEIMDPTLLLLFLLVIFSLLLRWRFSLSPAWMLIDASLLVFFSLLVPAAGLLLSLYLFYFISQGKYLYCVPYVVFLGLHGQHLELLVPLFSLVLGWLVGNWERERVQLRKEADEYMLRSHRLEEEGEHLLLDYADAQYLSRLQEREHIAQVLHDSLGHELTAAHLSVKALKTLLDREEREKVKETREKVEMRLSRALDQLKLAVRQLEPDEQRVQRSLEKLFEEFVYPVDYTLRGDISRIPPTLQPVLQSGIKEALTNIAKHANPSEVHACVDCNGILLRMVIENDGVLEKRGKEAGNGLRFLRRRVERLGGSMSIQMGSCFKLLISIPIQGEIS